MAPSEDRRDIAPQVQKLVEILVHNCRNPVRLLELYYWSTEPELLPIIRGIALMTNETRAKLEAYILGFDPKSLSARVEANGQIRLASKQRRKAA